MKTIKLFGVLGVLTILAVLLLFITCILEPSCNCNPKFHYLGEANNCCDAKDCKCIKSEWPNTSNYTRIVCYYTSDAAKENKISVSSGQKYYSDGIFSSIYGNSHHFAITSEQDCKITIDFKKFSFGWLNLYLNDKSLNSSIPADIKAGDVLVFQANPGNRYSLISDKDWMVRFYVEAASE